MVIDAHAHLTDQRFGADLEDVVTRARQAGLRRILTAGEDVDSSERALALARRHPDLIRVAVGIHPHRAETCDAAALGRLAELAADPLVVAIGEIGVDRSGRSADPDVQRRALDAQLDLAHRLALPVVLHLRDAQADLAAALDRRSSRGQLHCYSEGPAELPGWVARGLVPSFAGTVTFRRNDALRAAAALAPRDGLLVETDAPYLAPEPHRGGRNEPARVADIYRLLATARGEDVPALIAETEAAAIALFGARWG